MIESDWIEYLSLGVGVLFLISLFYNFKFLNTINKLNKNSASLIKSAYFNEVTELPNRANIDLVISDQIDREMRHNKSFLVTIVKIINYHEVKLRSKELSDEYMLEASNRLLETVRDEDIVGHITEDGFIIVFNEYLEDNNVDIVLNRIRAVFKEKPHINTKYNIDYKISLGTAKYPHDGSGGDLLIDRATQKALK